MTTNDRAISSAVSYVLTLGIVVLLLISLTGVFAPIVANQQDDAVLANLEVYGNDLAGDVESADRLAAGGADVVELRTQLPETVAGEPYEIGISDTGDGYEIELRSPDLDGPALVALETDTPIEETDTLEGGTIVISYNSGEDRLEVENA